MSSHVIFDNVFTAGSRSAGEIVPNECGPMDIIRSKVRELLEADATTLDIAGGSIQAFDFLPRTEDLSGRKIVVYSLPLLAEFRPIQCEANEIEIQIGLCWRTQNTTAVPDYAPTYLTALDHIKTVLRSDHHLSDTVNGIGLQLVRKSRPGSQAVAVLNEDDRGGTQFFVELGWIYSYDVDAASGQIKSITDAGA